MPDMSPGEIATEIATSSETQAYLLGLANEIAAEATTVANMTVGKRHMGKRGSTIKAEFGTDVTVGTDTARAHVWAKNGPAIHAERKDGILAAISDEYGKGHEGKGGK